MTEVHMLIGKGHTGDEGELETVNVCLYKQVLTSSSIVIIEKLCTVFVTFIHSAHLGPEPAVVKVQGLDSMNDDPAAVAVLFAKLCLTDASDRYVRL